MGTEGLAVTGRMGRWHHKGQERRATAKDWEGQGGLRESRRAVGASAHRGGAVSERMAQGGTDEQ